MPRADMYLLSVDPSTVVAELESFKEKLEVEVLPENLKPYAERIKEVTGSLAELASRLLNQFTTHAAMSVPPTGLERALRSYMAVLALELRDVLGRVTADVRQKCTPQVWASMREEERRRLVGEVLGALYLTKVTLTVTLYASQLLANIVSRAIPNLTLRSAPTVETLGKAIIRR